MSDLTPIDVVNLFDKKIKRPMNTGISWGSDNFPRTRGSNGIAEYRAWFTGPTSGVNQDIQPSALTGNADAEKLRKHIIDQASKFSVIRKVKIRMRYKINSSYNTVTA